MERIDDTVRIVHASDVVACDLDGGKALLDMNSSNYYRLNGSASMIWEWIGDGATLAELIDRMLQEYDVERDECEKDVEAVVSSFIKAGLLESNA